MIQNDSIKIENLINEIEALSKRNPKLKLPVGSLLLDIGIDMLRSSLGEEVAYDCVRSLLRYNEKLENRLN